MASPQVLSKEGAGKGFKPDVATGLI